MSLVTEVFEVVEVEGVSRIGGGVMKARRGHGESQETTVQSK
jgi:hypothetical protein